MKLNEAVKNAAIFLRMDDVITALEGGEPSAEITSEITMLVRCANLVLGELASDYLPLVHRETLSTTKDNTIFYSDFSRTPAEIKRVLDSSGKSVPYRTLYDRMIMGNLGEYTIEYSFLPEAFSLDSELPYSDALSPRLLGLGIASEYALISGMADEAITFDKRFRDGLTETVRKKSYMCVPKRRWA